ncbi:MAG: UDP-N-acetylglucosamine 2-epimerase [Nitrospirae bacterium]|nr:UDP-N-acetylglucosamine 2-epimerase [Nitrospirota bacterium]
MIHIILGTKAQLIKTAPLMKMMQSEGIPFNYISTGQHEKGMEELRRAFGLKEPDMVLHKGGDVISLPSIFVWSLLLLAKAVFLRKNIFRGDKSGIVLVHGDTFSTLIGALAGRFAGLKVAHVEAGLRSHDFLNPFPEELTRVFTSFIADYFFCPGQWAVNNLKKRSGVKINTFDNTLLDALHHALQNSGESGLNHPEGRYCVASIHRYENILSKKRLSRIVETVEKISVKCKTVFVLHPVTEKRLRSYGLYERLADNPDILPRGRYPYFDFIRLISHSEFIVTDGGSNQEESFYLGKPCLLLRRRTERMEGLGKNVCLSGMDDSAIDDFVSNYGKHNIPAETAGRHPSEIIMKEVRKFA